MESQDYSDLHQTWVVLRDNSFWLRGHHELKVHDSNIGFHAGYAESAEMGSMMLKLCELCDLSVKIQTDSILYNEYFYTPKNILK